MRVVTQFAKVKFDGGRLILFYAFFQFQRITQAAHLGNFVFLA
jgi:hypothetical protein